MDKRRVDKLAQFDFSSARRAVLDTKRRITQKAKVCFPELFEYFFFIKVNQIDRLAHLLSIGLLYNDGTEHISERGRHFGFR